jgi:hypothetical protein
MLNVVSITSEISKPLNKKKLMFIIFSHHLVHHNKHSLSGIVLVVRTTQNTLKLCRKNAEFLNVELGDTYSK